MQFQKQHSFELRKRTKEKQKREQEQRTQCPTSVFYENLRERLRPMKTNANRCLGKQAFHPPVNIRFRIA